MYIGKEFSHGRSEEEEGFELTNSRNELYTHIYIGDLFIIIGRARVFSLLRSLQSETKKRQKSSKKNEEATEQLLNGAY